MINESFSDFFEKKYWGISLQKYLIIFFIIVASLLALFGIHRGVTAWRSAKEAPVFVEISDIMDRINGAFESKNLTHFDEVAEDCKLLGKKHHSSSLVSLIFLCEYAAAMLGGDNKQAAEALHNAQIATAKSASDAQALIGAVQYMTQKELPPLATIKKTIPEKDNFFHELIIFLWGYVLRQRKGIIAAEEIWGVMTKNPFYKNSPFKALVIKARNWDF